MTDLLLVAFVFLIAAVLSVPIASRFGLGSVLGYLIAGVAISQLLGVMHVDVLSVQHFAEFGVVMMLFLIGLEVKPAKLWEMRQHLIGLGGLQVGITSIAVMIVALALGQPWTVALAIGLVFSLSSTAIVLQTLSEKSLLKSDAGQSSFAVLLFQDIAVIGMLALLPLLAITDLNVQQVADVAGGHGSKDSFVNSLNSWQRALLTMAAIMTVFYIGNYLARPLFRYISVARLRELFIAAALMIVIGIALIMSFVGLSPALGTFIAGVVLANSEYRHELESDIEPFKGLLLGLFFITVGAGINFNLLVDDFYLIVGLTLALMVLKATILKVLAYCFGLKGAESWLFALGLAQAGEFAFVLLSFAVAGDIIPIQLAELLLLVATLSMFLTPILFIVHDRLIAPRGSAKANEKEESINQLAKVIIIGHGRVGGIIHRIMQGVGVETTVIDYSSAQLDMIKQFGLHAFFGDGSRPDLLKSAGIDEAAVLVVAIDNKEKITQLVRYAVKHHPNVHIVARALDRMHVYDLWSVGCRDIIREYYDGSLRMGRSVLEALGEPRENADAMIRAFESLDRRSMIEVADLYDINTPLTENKAFIEKVLSTREQFQQELQDGMAANSVANKD